MDETLLDIILKHESYCNIKKCIINNSNIIKSTNMFGEGPIHLAICTYKEQLLIDIINLLIEYGADISCITHFGHSISDYFRLYKYNNLQLNNI
jgi:hypothetical protein